MIQKYNRTAFNALLETLTGVDKQTLDRIGGSLRKEGMVSVGGRGPNAPHITPEDAKNIILGLLGTDNASQAAKAAKAASEWKSEKGNKFGEAVVAILSDHDIAKKVSYISILRNTQKAIIGWSKLDPIIDVDEPRPDEEVFTPEGAIPGGKGLIVEAALTNGALNSIVSIVDWVEKQEEKRL